MTCYKYFNCYIIIDNINKFNWNIKLFNQKVNTVWECKAISFPGYHDYIMIKDWNCTAKIVSNDRLIISTSSDKRAALTKVNLPPELPDKRSSGDLLDIINDEIILFTIYSSDSDESDSEEEMIDMLNDITVSDID